MKHLRKFNEDSEFELNTLENDLDTLDNDLDNDLLDTEESEFSTSTFDNIESDLSTMSGEEKSDYLKSIISFCDQKLSDSGETQDDMQDDMQDYEMQIQDDEIVGESFGRIRKFR